jgi:NTF2-related export protein 1/2
MCLSADSSCLLKFLGATDFSKAYYPTLQSARQNIQTFYVQPKDGVASKASIVWNGNAIADPEALQRHFEEWPALWFDIQTVDCHVVNPRTFPELSNDKNFSMVVIVSGYMRVDDKEMGPMHEFSETFQLVPNREKMMQRGSGAGKRQWLIQSQIFRYLVSHEDTVGMEAGMEIDEDVH